MNRLIFLILVLGFSKILPTEYALFAKRETSSPIKYLCIFGERCSGTNYTQSLLLENLIFDSSEYKNIHKPVSNYGHKHFPPWFELPLKEYQGPRRYYSLEDNEETLFVVIFRDPYDWVRSFKKKPHHGLRELRSLPFSQFIRTPWQLNPNNGLVKSESNLNPLMDKDPFTGENFSNVLHLRSAKIRTMLLVKDKVHNAYYINYETVRDHPKEVLKEIEDIFGLASTTEFNPIIHTKGREKKAIYKPKEYPPINLNDLLFINDQLDEELERSIGYELTRYF